MKIPSKSYLSAIIPMVLMALVLIWLTPGESKTDQGSPQYVHPEAIASTDWLQTHIDDDNIRIVDCTVSYFEWNANSYQKGHIPGAVWLDLIGQLSNPKGQVPDLIDLPHMCPFAERCSEKMDICEQEKPELKDIKGDHLVRCFLYHKDTVKKDE